MSLADIPNGALVLLDANILIYARRRISGECEKLLERCSDGSLTGIVSTLALAEFCHRRMMQEAQTRILAGSNPAKTLGQKPGVVQQLTTYSGDVERLLTSSLQFLPIEQADFTIALGLQKQYGLLTNDSLIMASASRRGIQIIATADNQFDAAAGFTTYKPSDLPQTS
jgi:predicted nucleic acid-binding protein